jgi:peroxiredoxin/outer membrane lipoprotein-sorting protein
MIPRFLRLTAAALFVAGFLHAQESADAVLARVAGKARLSTTLTADIELTWQTPGQPKKTSSGTMRLMRPNLARISLQGDYPMLTFASDGEQAIVLRDPNTYSVMKMDPAGKNINSPWWGIPYRFFFTQSVNPFGVEADPDPSARRSVAEEEVNGERFTVLQTSGGDAAQPYSSKIYIGADSLIHRSSITFGGTAIFDANLSHIETNAPLEAGAFRYVPPPDAHDEGETSKLLAPGANAPDFTLPALGSEAVSLSKDKGAKATLVNFWYVACPPCRKEFPAFEKIYESWKKDGLMAMAINHGDSITEIGEYVRQTGITFPVLIGDESEPTVFDKYGVVAFPVTYLLDSAGKIVFRSAGIDEEGLRKALAALGLN